MVKVQIETDDKDEKLRTQIESKLRAMKWGGKRGDWVSGVNNQNWRLLKINQKEEEKKI